MKIIFFPLFMLLILLSSQSWCTMIDAYHDDYFTAAFTAGYVFKLDDGIFKKVYGTGMGNVLTADFCYHPWECWGFGAKASYWLALGRTTFFKRHTFLQEIPITLYVRTMHNFRCGLQLYASLGGGGTWIREESYLGTINQGRGIGEIEIGLDYPIWCSCLDFTSAFRYLFPRQSQKNINKIDVGGFDIRGGVSISF